MLKNIFPKVTRTKDGSRDIKILMMDVLKSPAVFRSFLESSKKEVEIMVENKVNDQEIEEHPYQRRRMFIDFKHSLTFLEEHEELQNNVRYFGHNPNCWMMILDDNIYYQPYTFGNNDEEDYSKVIGALFPVFKLRASDEDKNLTGNILTDHFRKLWLTSNVDFNYMYCRYKNKKNLIDDIFTDRSPWFRHVHGALYVRRGHHINSDERCDPRSCSRNLSSINVICGDQNVEGKVLNHSKRGIQIKTYEEIDLAIGDNINMYIRDDNDFTNYTLTNLSSKFKEFEVKHLSIDGKTTTFGAVGLST